MTQRPILRDALVVIAVTLAAFGLFVALQIGERLGQIAQHNEAVQLDEWPLTLAVFALMLAWFAWQRWREQRRAEQRLAELLEDNRRLSQQLISAQEAERARIARDLHDELGQCITAIQADAAAVLAHADVKTSAPLAASAAAIGDVAARMSGTLRRMLSALEPAWLDELGLAASLATLAEGWSRTHGVVCTHSIDASLNALPAAHALALYRCAQEALTNAAKHAGATRVALSAQRRANGDVELAVEDDGVGWPDAASARRGFGVRGMEERVRALGGTLTRTAASPRGARVEVRLPLTGGERA